MSGASMIRPLLLGVTAGMRSQMPLALLSIAANRGRFLAGSGRPWDLLGSREVLVMTGLLATGELVGDKLAITPSRLSPGPLVGRLGLGGFAGAVAARAARGSVVAGVAAGGIGAWIGAQAGYRARVALSRNSSIPDPIWGLIEDVAAAGIRSVALCDKCDVRNGSTAVRTR
jgi:uncharacterized membrane protein